MWGAIIQGILGLGQMAYGASQKKKAQKMTSPQPMLDIPDIYESNVGVMEKEVQTGYSPQTLKFLSDTFNQNLVSSTNAILQGGGGVNSIADLYANNAQQMRGLGVENEKLRMGKLSQLIETRKDLAGMQLKQWQMNVLDQWKNKQVAAAMIAQQGNQLINSGLNTTLGAVGQGIQYGSTKGAPSAEMNTQMKKQLKSSYYDDIYNVDKINPPQTIFDDMDFQPKYNV